MISSLIVFSVCCFFATIDGYPRGSASNLNPVILVPGDGGSQIEAKLNKSVATHFYCEKKTNDFFDLWLNLEQMVPYVIECWVDNMRLVFNTATGMSMNAPGVATRIPGFGNSTTVEWLDPSKLSISKYFVSIVDKMVSLGYKRGVSVRGAPYDFRKAPNEQREYFTNLKKLVEDTYNLNKNRKVILMGHSMGNPYILYFLNQQSKQWKEKYIHSMISLAGVWGGSAKPFRVMASGDNLEIWALSALKLRKGQRTYPSLTFLMPRVPFWNATDVFVTTPNANYSLSNIKQFFRDLNYSIGYDMYMATGHIMDKLEAPGVPVQCLHGRDVNTGLQYVYKNKQFPDTQPQIIYGDGDGTVNLRSLQGCLDWITKQKEPVIEKSYSGVDHMDILSDKNVLAYLTSLLAPSS